MNRKEIFIVVLVAVLLVCYNVYSLFAHYQICNFEMKSYKENMPLTITVIAETDNEVFHFHCYQYEVEGMIKKAISEISLDEIINNSQKIEEIVKNRFNMPKATLSFLSIAVTPPEEFIEAGKALKAASLTIQKDSLISASVKHDAVGYTPEAERLEERRDKRFDAQEERKIKMREIESNEKIKMRQAEAIENAANNMGVFGDLTITLH